MGKTFIKYKYFITSRNKEVHLTNSSKHHSCLTFIRQNDAENPSPILALTLNQINQSRYLKSVLHKQAILINIYVLSSNQLGEDPTPYTGDGGYQFHQWQPSLYPACNECGTLKEATFDETVHAPFPPGLSADAWLVNIVLFFETVTLSIIRLNAKLFFLTKAIVFSLYYASIIK